MAKRIRTFIAVEISRSIRQGIEDLQDTLGPETEQAKWVEPKNIHLTLKFLGEVDERDIYTVCKTVQEIVAGRQPFEMSVAGVGAFPNAKRPRVIWAGVTQGADVLTAIHQDLDKALSAQGYPREDRPFTPHLTLGRIRRTVPNPRLEAAIMNQADWEGGRASVHEILVMASELSADGPHYAVMSRAKLSGSADSDS